MALWQCEDPHRTAFKSHDAQSNRLLPTIQTWLCTSPPLAVQHVRQAAPATGYSPVARVAGWGRSKPAIGWGRDVDHWASCRHSRPQPGRHPRPQQPSGAAWLPAGARALWRHRSPHSSTSRSRGSRPRWQQPPPAAHSRSGVLRPRPRAAAGAQACFGSAATHLLQCPFILSQNMPGGQSALARHTGPSLLQE